MMAGGENTKRGRTGIWGVLFVVFLVLLLFALFYFAVRFTWHRMPFLTFSTEGPTPGYVTAGDNCFYMDGVKIQLRGVGIMPPILLENKGVDFSKYIAEIRKWGANTIRVPVYPVIYYLWENIPPWEDVDKAIAEAEKNGLMVILDFHSVGYPPEETYHTEPTGEQTENIFYYKNEWLFGFWEEASLRYREENTVIAYELFNEVKWPENDNYEIGWLRWKAFVEENLLSRIRRNDPHKLVLVSGLHYARDLTWAVKYPIADNNVGYKRTSYYEWNPKIENLPIIFAETDEYPLRTLDSMGISWLAYCFSAEWSPNLLLDYDGFTPSVYGRDVMGFLSASPPLMTGARIMELLLETSVVGIWISIWQLKKPREPRSHKTHLHSLSKFLQEFEAQFSEYISTQRSKKD